MQDSPRSLRSVAKKSSALMLRATGHQLNLIWSVAYWEAFFRRHNIVAFTQISETGTQILAQAIAIDWAGGISFSTHRSHCVFDYFSHARDNTVYFS